MTEKPKRNPLKFAWKFLTNIGGIIGLVSLTDDIIAWKQFIDQLAEAYQSLVYYPFSLFNIELNERLIDYFFVGSICGISYSKAIGYGIDQRLW